MIFQPVWQQSTGNAFEFCGVSDTVLMIENWKRMKRDPISIIVEREKNFNTFLMKDKPKDTSGYYCNKNNL